MAQAPWLTPLGRVGRAGRACSSAAPSSSRSAARAWSGTCCTAAARKRAFALRFDGRVVAYLNRCAHVPTELDWQEGEFLDAERRYILCSVHGAVYSPSTGACLMGRCGRAGLIPVTVRELDGALHWYPAGALQPLPPAAPGTPDGSDGPAKPSPQP
jgi:nitrite reductase/ring-hydroxylating ferredoxin subunit